MNGNMAVYVATGLCLLIIVVLTLIGIWVPTFEVDDRIYATLVLVVTVGIVWSMVARLHPPLKSDGSRRHSR